MFNRFGCPYGRHYDYEIIILGCEYNEVETGPGQMAGVPDFIHLDHIVCVMVPLSRLERE